MESRVGLFRLFTIALANLNVVLDLLSRIQVAASTYFCNLEDIHKKLGHPGITRLAHFFRTKNLPFSVDDVK